MMLAGVDAMWLAGILLLSAVVWVSCRPLLWWQYAHLPGSSLLLGGLLGYQHWDVADLLHKAGLKHGRHIFKVWVGSTPCIVINHPELAHHVCVRINERFHGHAAHDCLMLPKPQSDLLDLGLLLNNGNGWRQARRAFELSVMQPMSLAQHQVAMHAHARQLCDVLAVHAADGSYCDIYSKLSQMNMELVGAAAYGVDFKLQAAAESIQAVKDKDTKSRSDAGVQKPPSDQQRLVSAVTTLMKQAPNALERSSWVVRNALCMPQLRPLFERMLNRTLDKAFQAHMKMCGDVLDCSTAVISASKAQDMSFRPGSKGSGSQATGCNIREDSLLGQLLEARTREKDVSKRLSQAEVIAQPLAFTIAGSTTASVLTLCIYLLSKHPIIEMKLIDEVDSALKQIRRRAANVAAGQPRGSAPATPRPTEPAPSPTQQRQKLASTQSLSLDDTPVDISDLRAEDLPYTEAVIKEVMRIYPAGGPVIRRQAPPEGLDIDALRIPGNAALLIPVSNFQHDEVYFPHPDQFRPERFLEVRGGPALHEAILQRNLAATTPYAYMPFGAGGRMCVAYKYALLHTTLALATLYSRYSFRLQPGQEPLPIHKGFVLTPANGLWVKVQERPLFRSSMEPYSPKEAH